MGSGIGTWYSREGVVRFGGSNRLKLEADDIDLTGDMAMAMAMGG